MDRDARSQLLRVALQYQCRRSKRCRADRRHWRERSALRSNASDPGWQARRLCSTEYRYAGCSATFGFGLDADGPGAVGFSIASGRRAMRRGSRNVARLEVIPGHGRSSLKASIRRLSLRRIAMGDPFHAGADPRYRFHQCRAGRNYFFWTTATYIAGRRGGHGRTIGESGGRMEMMEPATSRIFDLRVREGLQHSVVGAGGRSAAAAASYVRTDAVSI